MQVVASMDGPRLRLLASLRRAATSYPGGRRRRGRRGIVWLDAGRVVVDGDFNVLFESGPHQNGDFTAFCAAVG